MASPISFGDAYTMAKIAYRLGRAFTKGRRSAPAEFQEVENQLYGLSAALESIKKAADQGEIRGPAGLVSDNDPISLMLANCNETLCHLDNIIKDYGSLSNTTDISSDNEPAFARIGKTLKRNWRKIKWTTEGGDLATLRSQLILHTNSLGLVLSAVNNTRTAKMSSQVTESSEILRKLYQLFLDSTATSGGQKTVAQAGSQSGSGLAIIYFKLQAEGFVCNRAALQVSEYFRELLRDKESNTFQCHCSQLNPASTDLHTDQVSALTFSPSTFPVRLSGNPRSWIIYKMKSRDTHLLENLTLQSLNLKYMSSFEEGFIDRLAIHRAQELLQQGMNTTVAHLSLSADYVRLLNFLGNTSSTRFIRSVTFSTEARSFTWDNIASVNLFHYKSLPTRHVADNTLQASEILYDNCAELTFYYTANEGSTTGISKSIVYLEHSTKLKRLSTDERGLSIEIGPVRCATFSCDKDEEARFDGLHIVLSFSDADAANTFQLKLREMQVDLFAINHTYPRPDESLLLHLQAEEISFEDLHIENGIIEIAVSRINNQHRLIIKSENGYVALSQDLPEDFISSVERGATPGMDAPTREIRMQERNGAVYRHVPPPKKGLGRFHIGFAATSNSRLLELGLLALTG